MFANKMYTVFIKTAHHIRERHISYTQLFYSRNKVRELYSKEKNKYRLREQIENICAIVDLINILS